MTRFGASKWPTTNYRKLFSFQVLALGVRSGMQTDQGKLNHLSEAIKEARQKKQDFVASISRVARLLGTDANGAQLIVDLPVWEQPVSTSWGPTDADKNIISFLSSQQGTAVASSAIIAHTGLTSAAVTARMGKLVRMNAVTRLRKGYYTVSGNGATTAPAASSAKSNEYSAPVQKVLAFIETQVMVTPRSVREAVGCSKSMTHKYLNLLYNDGLIIMEGMGKYKFKR